MKFVGDPMKMMSLSIIMHAITISQHCAEQKHDVCIWHCRDHEKDETNTSES